MVEYHELSRVSIALTTSDILPYMSDNVFIIYLGACVTMDTVVFLTFPEAVCDNFLVLCDMVKYQHNRK